MSAVYSKGNHTRGSTQEPNHEWCLPRTSECECLLFFLKLLIHSGYQKQPTLFFYLYCLTKQNTETNMEKH